MVSKRFLRICIVGLVYSLGIVNGFTSNTTTTLNNKTSNKINTKNNNKKFKQKKNGIIDTVRNNIYEEIAKDTKKRSKLQPHIASRLPANLPRQLIQCMENALKNNKQIEEAQKEILATNEQHNIDRASLMPRITAENSTSASRDYLNKPENTYDNIKNQQYKYNKSNTIENTTNLSVRYNIFHGGADIANLESTDKSIEAKWKNYDATIQKVLQEVAQNYFAVFAKQEEIKNIKALIDARKETLRVADEMLKTGTAKQSDVDQAQVGYSEAQLRLENAQAEEQIYRTNLKQLTGVEVTETLEAPDKLFDKKFNKKEALDIAIKNNPQIIAIIAEQAAAKAKLSVPNGEFVPSIDLVASGTRKFDNTKYYDVKDSVNYRHSNKQTRYDPSIAIQLSWPIFNGLSSFSKKVQQAYNVAKVSVTKNKIYTEIEKELSTVLTKIELADSSIIHTNEMIKAQNKVLNSTKEEYSAGTKLIRDVLESQQKLFEYNSALTNNIRDRYINQCNLMGLLGWFNPSDLKLKGLKFNYIKEYYRQIERILPTWEEMGVETSKPVIRKNNSNRKQKVVNINNN